MKQIDPVEMIRIMAIEEGSQSAVAKKFKVSDAYISYILAGKKDPGPSILASMGLKRIITYVPVDKAECNG